jgi:hypothetical protein
LRCSSACQGKPRELQPIDLVAVNKLDAQMTALSARAAAADRLRRISQRRAAFPDERDDIALALEALGGADGGHPLADLLHTLNSAGAEMAYISRDQARWLLEAAEVLERAVP